MTQPRYDQAPKDNPYDQGTFQYPATPNVIPPQSTGEHDSLSEKKPDFWTKKKIAVSAVIASALGIGGGVTIATMGGHEKSGQAEPVPSASAPQVPGSVEASPTTSETEKSQEFDPETGFMVENGEKLTASDFVNKYRPSVDKFNDQAGLSPEQRIELAQNVTSQYLGTVIPKLIGTNVGADSTFAGVKLPGGGDAQMTTSKKFIEDAFEQLELKGGTDQPALSGEGFTSLKQWVEKENRNAIVIARSGASAEVSVSDIKYSDTQAAADGATSQGTFTYRSGSRELALKFGNAPVVLAGTNVRHEASKKYWDADINITGLKDTH